jgi:hypothetical protein
MVMVPSLRLLLFLLLLLMLSRLLLLLLMLLLLLNVPATINFLMLALTFLVMWSQISHPPVCFLLHTWHMSSNSFNSYYQETRTQCRFPRPGLIVAAAAVVVLAYMSLF